MKLTHPITYVSANNPEHRGKFRVLLDGTDVTAICVEANSELSRVRLQKVMPAPDGSIDCEDFDGDVEIVPVA